MSELEELALAYGRPERFEYELHADSLFGPVNRMEIRGEVVFVLQRAGGRILLITKSFYPPGVWRLPTGGIGRDEPIAEALEREVWEETRLRPPIERFAAVIHYRIHVSKISTNFYSYLFLLDARTGEPIPEEDESITGFREVEPAELGAIAEQLRRLEGRWKAWGRLRAIAHEVAQRSI